MKHTCTLQTAGTSNFCMGFSIWKRSKKCFTITYREDDLILYGNYKAKVPLKYIDSNKLKNSNLILVSAILRHLQVGKNDNIIGWHREWIESANNNGRVAEPSLSVFGMKGGATGSGRAQVVPMEDIPALHGDFATIEKAHNLLAALIDNNIQIKNIIRNRSSYRSLETSNGYEHRSLRKLLSPWWNSLRIPRETGFDITAASEVMVSCPCRKSYWSQTEIGEYFCGIYFDKNPLCTRFESKRAMTALLKIPSCQSCTDHWRNPAIIHGGPFANIAQGTKVSLQQRWFISFRLCSDWSWICIWPGGRKSFLISNAVIQGYPLKQSFLLRRWKH